MVRRTKWKYEWNSIGISHNGMDHGFFLQCSKNDIHYEGPVIIWGPDPDEGEIIADSFIEFLEQLPNL